MSEHRKPRIPASDLRAAALAHGRTVRDIMAGVIRAAGADGLVHPETQCGCGLHDLFITEYCPNRECELARCIPCIQCGEERYYPLAADPKDTTCPDCREADA